MSQLKANKHAKLDARPPKQPRKPMPEITFHNIRLTKADRDALDDFVTRCQQDSTSPLDYLVERGYYKVSLRVDDASEAVMVSITGSDDSVNPLICVTTYADSVAEALWMALYKAYDPKTGEWLTWELEPERGNKRWG